MRIVAPLTAVLALSACATTTPTAPEATAAGQKIAPGFKAPSETVPTDVRRTTLIVRDIDNSLKLYRDALGLQVNYDIETTMSGVALPAGEPGAKARLVLLNANDPWVGMIGLLEWLDPPIPAEDYPTRMKPGGVVIVLNTDDVDGRCAKAAHVPGTTVTAPARMQTYPSRNGSGEIRVRGCNIFDPDGILLEINQILD